MSEEKKRVSLEIDATLTGDDLKTKLSEMYENVKKTEQSFASMKEGMADMPILGEMLNAQLQTTESLASTVGNKITSLMRAEGDMDDETRINAINNLNSSYRELSIMSSMQSGDQVFGVKQVRQFAQTISKNLASAFDQILPQVTNMIRTKINSPTAGEEMFGRVHSVKAMQDLLIKDKDVLRVLQNNMPEGTLKNNAATVRNFLGIAASRAMNYHAMDEFTQKMFGRNAASLDYNKKTYEDPRSYIPDSFKHSYDAREYVPKEKHRSAEKVLSNDVRQAIITEMNNNPVLFKAAERAQLIRRDSKHGDPFLVDDITDMQFDRLREEAYKQLVVRGTGMGKYELEDQIYYDDKTSPKRKNTIASRFHSGTTRQSLESLIFLDRLGDSDENYVDVSTPDRNKGSRIRPKKPLLDMYQIGRASPFIRPETSGDFDQVAINESDITRMLGIDKRGDRAKAYDLMSTVSLEGYDPENEKHKKLLKQIYEKGIWVNKYSGSWKLDKPTDENGKALDDYVLHKFHAAHRGEDGAVLRMLNADEMRRIKRETGAKAKELGLSGNYLDMFSVDSAKSFGELLENGEYLANDEGKFFDAINKMYSPSRKIENNLKGKKIAVVDIRGMLGEKEKKIADGAGWASSDIISHSIQARGASGFKGQLIPFYGKNMGEFLIRSGLATKTLASGEADPEGKFHFWAKSINGKDMVDLMDAEVVTDQSLWKNAKRQFKNKKGEWYSADKINDLAGKLLGEFSLSEMVDLDKESDANELGTQLTSYMVLNPKMRKMQLEGYKKRMAELETYEGMKKYVFANPESDEMAAELQDPKNLWLLNTKKYQDRVNLYKQALLHDVSTHKFVDFSEDEKDSFTNVTNSINPLTTLLQMKGEVPKHILDTAREALNASRKDKNQREYTDEDVKDILLLRRSKDENGKEISNVIDYGTDDEYVSYARSPAAFGAFVYAKNRAKEMSVIQNALLKRGKDDPSLKHLFGEGNEEPLLHQNGVFLGQEDWEVLSGMDVDGDRIKRIRGVYAEMMKESLDRAESLKAFSEQIDPKGNMRFGLMKLEDIKTNEKTPNDVKAFIADIERLASEGKEMGIANAAAMNPMQMRLDDITGAPFILSARYGNKIYDEYASTYRKNPKKQIAHGREWWDSLSIGRNFDMYLSHEDRLFQFSKEQQEAIDNYYEAKEAYESRDPDKKESVKDLEKRYAETTKELENKKVFLSSRGHMINLKEMAGENDKAWGLNINMPSVNMDGHLLGISAAKTAYRLGQVDLGRGESISEAIRYNIENKKGPYADATDEIKEYASSYLQMFPQFSYGARGNISARELDDLRAKRQRAIASIDDVIKARRKKEGLSDTAAYFNGGKSIKEYRDKMLGKYFLKDGNGINVIENIGQFGFTTENLENELRQEALHHFFNDPNIGLVDRNQTMMQQMKEAKRIEENAISKAEESQLTAIENFDTKPDTKDNSVERANNDANRAEEEAKQAQIEAAEARKSAAESKKEVAEAQKSSSEKAQQALSKAEQRHAVDYAEYTVTRTMGWMETDSTDEYGNDAITVKDVYTTNDKGKTVKGNMKIGMSPYTPKGSKRKTRAEGRAEQASNEKYGTSSSTEDALLGSAISHVMDNIGGYLNGTTIYGNLHDIEKSAYGGLKEFFTNHKEEMTKLGITFNEADMSSFDPNKSYLSYSGSDAKTLAKIEALTPARFARYLVDDIGSRDRTKEGTVYTNDASRKIVATEGKIMDPVLGTIINESTLVSGPSGGEKEIAYTLPGIKNSKGEDVVTRFAPDYIAQELSGKQKGKYIIGDHKSSPTGAKKGLLQTLVYASWLDDLAEEYYRTKDEKRKSELDPYKIFGQLNDKGEYESNIAGVETRDFFTGKWFKTVYNQERRRQYGVLMRNAQDAKYQEAMAEYAMYGLRGIDTMSPDANRTSLSEQNTTEHAKTAEPAKISDRQRDGLFQEFQLLANQYSGLMDAARSFNGGLKSELYKDREETYADNYFGKTIGNRNRIIESNNKFIKQYKEYLEKTEQEDKVGIINQLNDISTLTNENFAVGTRAWAQNRSKSILDNAENFGLRKLDPFFHQRGEIDKQNKNVKEMESTLDNFILSRFEKEEISRDEQTGEVDGVIQKGKKINVRDAVLENAKDRETVNMMKKRLEALKSVTAKNIDLIDQEMVRSTDKEIADLEEHTDAMTRTNETPTEQRERYWKKERRKRNDSIADNILARDAINVALKDEEAYKKGSVEREQLLRRRNSLNESIKRETEYMNNHFDENMNNDLDRLRNDQKNELRHYFSGTRNSAIASMISNGMQGIRNLKNGGDRLNATNQMFQGIDREMSLSLTRNQNYSNDLASLTGLSPSEKIDRYYEEETNKANEKIIQIKQEMADLDQIISTGRDSSGRKIIDLNTKTGQDLKERITQFRDSLGNIAKEIEESVNTVVPQKAEIEKTISRNNERNNLRHYFSGTKENSVVKMIQSGLESINKMDNDIDKQTAMSQLKSGVNDQLLSDITSRQEYVNSISRIGEMSPAEKIRKYYANQRKDAIKSIKANEETIADIDDIINNGVNKNGEAILGATDSETTALRDALLQAKADLEKINADTLKGLGTSSPRNEQIRLQRLAYESRNSLRHSFFGVGESDITKNIYEGMQGIRSLDNAQDRSAAMDQLLKSTDMRISRDTMAQSNYVEDLSRMSKMSPSQQIERYYQNEQMQATQKLIEIRQKMADVDQLISTGTDANGNKIIDDKDPNGAEFKNRLKAYKDSLNKLSQRLSDSIANIIPQKEDIEKILAEYEQEDKLANMYDGTRRSSLADMLSTRKDELAKLTDENAKNRITEKFKASVSRYIGRNEISNGRFANDLARMTELSPEEQVDRYYQDQKDGAMQRILQMKQEAAELEKVLKTGKDSSGRRIIDRKNKNDKELAKQIQDYIDSINQDVATAERAIVDTLPQKRKRDVAARKRNARFDSELRTMQYEYGAEQLRMSEAQRSRQLDNHIYARSGRFQQELTWRRSQYDSAVLREKSYTSQQKQLEKDISNLNDKKSSAATQEDKDRIGSEITAATDKYNSLTEAIANARREQQEFGASGQEVAAALTAIGEKITQVARQFGARIFRKAMQEAISFVKSYDAAMTEIQMVTLKTDAQISNIGKGLIDSAVQLKAPIQDVTSAATALYRQGLGDEEVQTRLQDVIKFSTTAGVKAADAVKLITVSLNSGLVSSSQQAMDVISALGDSAATTAAEITKGLQKSVYAAKDVGVSYNELVSMLTAITAGTQLGGNIAGTAMQTFMSRFSKIGTNELIYDENGNQMSGSALSTILQSVGINTYEGGQRRKFTDVLRELSGSWEGLSDARKSQISYAFGGTRQYSNLNALLTAFSEMDENGQTMISKYLGIADDSEGITNEKYQNYTESLAASFNNLRNSFDSVVEAFTNTGALTGFIDFLSGALQGVTTLTENLGGLGVAITALAAVAIPVISMLAGGGLPGLLVGTATAAGVIAAFAGYNTLNQSKESHINQTKASIEKENANRVAQIKDNLSTAKQLNQKRLSGKSLSSSEQTRLTDSLAKLNELGAMSTNASVNIDALASSAEATAKALDGVSTSASSLSDRQAKELWNAFTLDVEDDKENYKKDEDKVTITKDEREIAASAIAKMKNGSVSDNAIDLVPIIQGIDMTGLKPITIGGQKETPGNFAPEQIASVLRDAFTYSEVDLEELGITDFDLSEYKELMDIVESVIAGDDKYGRQKSPNIFGSRNAERIKEVVTQTLAGTDYQDITDDVVNSIITEANNAGNFDFIADGDIRGYAARYRQKHPQKEKTKNPIIDNFFGGAASSLASESNVDERFNDLYEWMLKQPNAASKRSIISALNGQVKLGKNGAFPYFETLLQDKDFSKALLRFATKNEDGTYTLNENVSDEDFDYFMRTIASKGTRFKVASYRSNRDILSSAQTGISSLNEGSKWADLTDDVVTDITTVIGEEYASKLANGETIDSTLLNGLYSRYLNNVSPYSQVGYAKLGQDLLSKVGTEGFNLEQWKTTNKLTQTDLDSIFQLYDGLKELASMTDEELQAGGYNPEEIRKGAKKALDLITTISDIGESDWSDMSKNAITKFSGTYAEQLSEYSDLISQNDSFVKAKNAIEKVKNGTWIESDLSALQSLTGIKIDFRNVDTAIDDVEAVYNTLVTNFSNGLNETLQHIIPEGMLNNIKISKPTLNTSELVGYLGNSVEEWVKRAIEDLGVAITNGEFTYDVEEINNLTADTVAGIANQYNNNQRMKDTNILQAINSILLDANANLGTEIAKHGYSSEEMFTWFANNPVASAISKRPDTGYSDVYSAIISGMINPQENKGVAYNQKLLQHYIDRMNEGDNPFDIVGDVVDKFIYEELSSAYGADFTNMFKNGYDENIAQGLLKGVTTFRSKQQVVDNVKSIVSDLIGGNTSIASLNERPMDLNDLNAVIPENIRSGLFSEGSLYSEENRNAILERLYSQYLTGQGMNNYQIAGYAKQMLDDYENIRSIGLEQWGIDNGLLSGEVDTIANAYQGLREFVTTGPAGNVSAYQAERNLRSQILQNMTTQSDYSNLTNEYIAALLGTPDEKDRLFAQRQEEMQSYNEAADAIAAVKTGKYNDSDLAAINKLSPYQLTRDNIGAYFDLAQSSIIRTRGNKRAAMLDALNILYPDANVTDKSVLDNISALGIEIKDGKFRANESIEQPSVSSLSARTSMLYNKEAVDRNDILSQISGMVNGYFYKEGYEGSLFDLLPDSRAFRDFFNNQQANGLVNELLIAANNKTIDQNQFNNLFDAFVNPNGNRTADYYDSALKYYKDKISKESNVVEGSFDDYIVDMLTQTFGETFTKARTDSGYTGEDTFSDMYLEIAKKRMDKYTNKNAYSKAVSLLDSYINNPDTMLQSDVEALIKPVSVAKDQYNNYASRRDSSGISSLIGWSQDVIDKKMETDEGKTEVEDAIDEVEKTTIEAITMMIDTLRASIASAYNITGSVEEIDGKIAEVAGDIGEFFTKLVEKYGHLSIKPEADQTYSELYDKFIEGRNTASEHDIFAFAQTMKKEGKTFENVTATPDTYEDSYIRSLLGDKSYMNMYEANRSNILSDDAFNTYLSNRQNGVGNQFSAYQNILDNMFGGGVEGGFSAALDSGTLDAQSFTQKLSESDYSWIREYIESLSGGKEALEDIARGGDAAKDGISELGAVMRTASAEAESSYNKNLSKSAQLLNDLKKDASSAGKALGTLKTQANNAFDNILASQKMRGKTGKGVDKTTRGIIGEFLGVTDDKQIQKLTKEEMERMADMMEKAGNEELMQGPVQTLMDSLESAMNSITPEQLQLVQPILMQAVADGQIDTSEFESMIAALQNDTVNAAYSAVGPVASLILEVLANGNTIEAALKAGEGLGTALLSGTKASVTAKTGKNTPYRSHGGGGGGGGGKSESATEKLVNRVKKGEELYNHQLKMIQYEETKYQNAGQLTLYGNEVQREIDLEKAYLPALNQNIKALKSQMTNVKKGSEDWYKLREALFNAEEQYADITNTIKDNEKKLKENQDAIRKTRTALEDLLNSQIEERIKKQRDMLAGTVDMQSIILDAIRQRYQDEWDLVKKDIEKKKEALEKEKALIDERLNMRKNAADEAEKYEELAELKAQFARVSMDSTRTKDAADLREKIAKLEEDIGWDIAEQQAESEKQQIDDQINGYDEYVNKGDEDLAKFLEDTNNFTDQVTKILGMSHDELFAWLKNNVTDFKNSLDEVQQQMINSWEDTYKQMFGLTDTYWDQIEEILSSKDSFLKYMKESDEYINASETEKQSLLYEWEKLYDDYWNAYNSVYAPNLHDDSLYGDWNGSEYVGGDGGGGGSGSGGSGGGGGTKYYGVFNREGKLVRGFTDKNRADSYLSMISDNEGYKVKQITKSQYDAGPQDSGPAKPKDTTLSNISSTVSSTVANIANATSSLVGTIVGAIGNFFNKPITRNNPTSMDTGGYTGNQEGLVYIHKKERVLNPQQTEAFDRMMHVAEAMHRNNAFDSLVSQMNDWSTNTVIPTEMPSFSPSDFKNSTTNTIGDIIITLNEAKLENDADYEAVAQRVGEKFVKELTKQGLGVSAFGF